MVIVSFTDTEAIDEYFLKLAKGKSDYEDSVLGAQEEIITFRSSSSSTEATAKKYIENIITVDMTFKYISEEYEGIIKAELEAEDLVVKDKTEEEEAKQEAEKEASGEGEDGEESSDSGLTKLEIEGLPLIKAKVKEYAEQRKNIINKTLEEHREKMSKTAKEANKYMGANLNPLKISKACNDITDSNTLSLICEALLKEYDEEIDTLIL